MKKLIIYWHPNQKSYWSAIVESYKDWSEAVWHEVQIMDIYREYRQDFLEFVDTKNDESKKQIQDKISRADEVCFVFPMWNFEEPAIVKNFYDINFSKWFGYKVENGKSIWLLSGKSGRIITTAWVDSVFIRMLYKILFWIIWWNGRFGFCGMKYLWCSINLDTMNPKKDDQRKDFLTNIYRLWMK